MLPRSLHRPQKEAQARNSPRTQEMCTLCKGSNGRKWGLGTALPGNQVQGADKTNRPSPALLTPESPFRPPNGFHEVQSDVLSSTPSAFGAVSGDLSGKKVWHITAPTSVPLSSIKSFDVDAVRNGSPIFTYGRRQYGFSTASRERRYLLLPEDSSSSYKRLKTSISTSYHLREIPDEEQPPAEINFFAKTAPLPKPPPEQPKMLKMRYRAFGTGDNPSASTYVSESLLAEKAGFQHPVHPSSPVPEATSKKGKRHKRLKPSDQVEVVDDSMQIDESPARTSMVQVPSSQANISVSKTPHIISNAEEDKATPRRKKRKQKKLQGDPSS